MAEFHLKVVASDKIFYNGFCQIAIVPGLDGEWAFMAHHDDIIVAVQPGQMRFQKPDGTWETAIVGSGFAQTANNRTMVIVDTAERPEEIDEVRAREELERAQEAMRQKQSIQEYRISQASLARAISRLKGKKDKNINL
ncbi:MAG: ATP synthase F1 subunit epsilon [Lachnospiraceae bacterium]|nr:ATP synthase F1 subunit epsilon [Lachnospiraceae bacterium]